MKKSKELSAAATKHVLRVGTRDLDKPIDLRDSVPVDFLRSIKELPRSGGFLKNSSPV